MPGFGRSTDCQGTRSSWTRPLRRGRSAVVVADVTRGRASDRPGAGVHVFSSWRARSIANGLDHPLCDRGAFLGSSWALARTSWSMTPYRVTSTVPRFPRGNRRRRGVQRQCRRAGLEPTTAVWLRQSSRNDGGARVFSVRRQLFGRTGSSAAERGQRNCVKRERG
jgi:hypothetical protein